MLIFYKLKGADKSGGEIDEYVKIEQTISPKVLSDVTKWIETQIK